MVERLVLHIGTHKTGTTAIQSSLADAHELLLARGVVYPETGRLGPGHAFLASEVIGAPPTRPVQARLIDEVRKSGASTVVLSSEVFSQPANADASANWAESIAGALRARDVRILAYARPQGEYMESLYVQRVRAGLVWASFEEFVDRCLRQPDEFDYPRLFAPWSEAFGVRLEVRAFVAEALFGGDAVPDFWGAAGLGPPPARGQPALNPRAGARATEMLRALTAALAERGLDGVLPPRRVLARARRRIEAELPEDPPFSGLTPDLAARVDERFAASNDVFVNDYLDRRHATLFRRTLARAGRPVPWTLDDANEDERKVFTETLERTVAELGELQWRKESR